MTMTAEWNPRYLAYARSQGREPEAQLAHDRAAWPGGRMCGYILWINARVAEFRAAAPDAVTRDGIVRDHPRFDRWLADLVSITYTLDEYDGASAGHWIAHRPGCRIVVAAARVRATTPEV